VTKTPPERPADPHTPTPSKSSPTPVEHTVAAAPATHAAIQPLPDASNRTALGRSCSLAASHP
jgi:hypothetical protein